LYVGGDVIQLRPAMPFVVVNIDSMCEPVSGKAASCPYIDLQDLKFRGLSSKLQLKT
jgi:hypothetical protein